MSDQPSGYQLMEEALQRAEQLDRSGELTVGDIFHPGFYRIPDGQHANRIVIYHHGKIDDKPILTFANGMTWIFREQLAPARCERAHPTFNRPRHRVDTTRASWYSDSGSGPHHHEW